MQHTEELNFETLDSNGFKPDTSLIETYWRHTGNGKIYELFDFAWNGADDTWMIAMNDTTDENKPTIVRPVEHLNGNRDDGSKRYVQVDEDYNDIESEEEHVPHVDDDGQEE